MYCFSEVDVLYFLDFSAKCTVFRQKKIIRALGMAQAQHSQQICHFLVTTGALQALRWIFKKENAQFPKSQQICCEPLIIFHSFLLFSPHQKKEFPFPFPFFHWIIFILIFFLCFFFHFSPSLVWHKKAVIQLEVHQMWVVRIVIIVTMVSIRWIQWKMRHNRVAVRVINCPD